MIESFVFLGLSLNAWITIVLVSVSTEVEGSKSNQLFRAMMLIIIQVVEPAADIYRRNT